MSWFDARIEWTEETERFREMLERLGREVTNSADTMRAISDDVFTAIATEAVEDARDIPLDPDTIERRTRAVKPKTKRRRRRRGRGGKKPRKVVPTPSPGVFNNLSHNGLVAALTTTTSFRREWTGTGRRSHQSTREFRGGSPVALREQAANELRWGTKRWVTYAHPHIDGTSRGLPARLAALQPRMFESAAAERTKDVLADRLADQLEAAGAPREWIQEVLEGRA